MTAANYLRDKIEIPFDEIISIPFDELIRYLNEFAAEKNKEIEQLKARLEMEQVEREFYYNRLMRSEGTDKNLQENFDELAILYKKREELKKKIA